MSSLNKVFGCFSLALWLCAVGCGTPGAPLPPSLRLPTTVNDLAAERKGTRVTLTWTQPTQTTDKQNIRVRGITRVCRAIGEFPMSECRELVKDLGPSEIVSMSVTGSNPRVVFEDVLAPRQLNDAIYASYAIEVFNDRDRNAGFSNQVRVPLVTTLPPPAELKVDVTPSGPVLRWTSVGRGDVPEPRRGIEFRYRIYRRVAGERNFVVLDDVPLNGPARSNVDQSFQWESTYEYKITPLTLISQNGRTEEVEGEDSPVVRALIHDIFPPERPTGVQAVFSGAGQRLFIDLTWAPNTEADLAGYNVFRSEVGQPSVRINQELAKAPSFRDESVRPGHVYGYSVEAVDARGNRSRASEPASETVPQQ